jgi:NAD(P)H-hydrate repair Nnr-like enzyme with NAD(P)H-hydrate epimerase domain
MSDNKFDDLIEIMHDALARVRKYSGTEFNDVAKRSQETADVCADALRGIGIENLPKRLPSEVIRALAAKEKKS